MEKLSNTVLISAVEALTHSNWIEDEFSIGAALQSFEAFNYLLTQKFLSSENILISHGILMEDMLSDDKRGQWRNCAVKIGGEVKRNVGRPAINSLICDWISEYGVINTKKKIIKSHVAFEQIHPFIDGNGRIGRMIMLWQCIKANIHPIVIKIGTEQMKYYQWFRNG